MRFACSFPVRRCALNPEWPYSTPPDGPLQDELLAQAHALIVDDAVLVWVVHDTNPHALSTNNYFVSSA